MFMRVSLFSFIESFSRAGRKGHFSHEAFKAIFDHIEEIESDTGEQIELNPIAICYEFTEYNTVRDGAEAYGVDVEGLSEEDIIDAMSSNCLVLKLKSGGVVLAG